MPRTNANDEIVVVRRWFVSHGDWVEPGCVIAEVETSKAMVEVAAEESGFLLRGVSADEEVTVGAPLAWYAENAGDEAPAPKPARSTAPSATRLISRDAAALLEARGVLAEEIAGNGPIRKADVETFLAQKHARAHRDWRDVVAAIDVREDSMLVFGAEAQGVVVLDCLELTASGSTAVFVDDAPKRAEILGVPVVHADALEAIRKRGVKRAHISIAAPKAKVAVAERLERAGFEIAGVRHPSASVAQSALIGKGVFLGPLTIVGPEAVLEDFVQVNNAATVAHHCVLRRAARLSDGVRLAGSVVIEEGAFLGLAVTVNQKIVIGSSSIVVSGVNVFDDVPPNSIVRVDGKAYPLR